MESISTAARNKMALQYGLLIGVIYIALTTVTDIFVSQFLVFNAMKFIFYVVYFILVAVMAGRIRKANGGYMDFKEAYSSVFIMVLIAGSMQFIYNYLYIAVIDPHFMDKIRTSTIGFMQSMKVSDEKMDESLRKFDEEVAKSKNFNIGKVALSLLENILIDSLLGLIVALIVRKNKPIVDTW